MNIWKVQPTVEEINKMSSGTLMEAIGIEITDFTEDSISGKMPVDERTFQPMRLLHGGASIALAETLGSVASHLSIDHKTHFAVGQTVSSNHIKSAKSGYVYGTARPKHLGRSTHIWEIEIRNEDNELVNTTTLTMAIREKR